MYTKFTVECTFDHDELDEDATVLLMRFLTSELLRHKLYEETKLAFNEIHIIKHEAVK